MAAPESRLPRVRVAALMLRDGKVVTVRHRRGNDVYHLLPGGGVLHGETLASALEREVAEETGLECRVGRPLVINDTIDPGGDRHVVNITFECSDVRGSITQSPDDPRVEAVDLVVPHELTSLDMRPPITEILIEALDRGAAFHAKYAGSVFVDHGAAPAGRDDPHTKFT